MSLYIIGDVHGCYNELKKLLDIIKFNYKYDTVIFVGDLIGRGPNPAEVLDLIIDLGDAAINVIGNHDLKFLAAAYNIISIDQSYNSSTLFLSNKLPQYISLLSSSKLVYINNEYKILVTHAGIPPNWDIKSTLNTYTTYFYRYLKLYGWEKILEIIFSGECLIWTRNLTEEDLIRYIIFGLTQIKFCFKNGNFDKIYQCAPGKQPYHLVPWFLLRDQIKNNNYTVIFGHWAALNLFYTKSFICCDTACVWGEKLTAIKISPFFKIYQVQSNTCANPKF